MSNARENYKAIFGVYPNGPSSPPGQHDDPDKSRGLVVSLAATVSALHAHWDRSQLGGVSTRSQELLSQIKAAVIALQEDLSKTS